MYCEETRAGRGDQVVDGLACGRIQIRRRRAGTGQRPPGMSGRPSNDSGRRAHVHKVDLVLYVSRESQKCQKAIRTIHQVLEQYDSTEVRLVVRDLSNDGGADGDEDAVVFTPTLVKRGPGPRTWIIGNLEQTDLLVELLEVSGVRRKK
jgi:KaiB domain